MFFKGLIRMHHQTNKFWALLAIAVLLSMLLGSGHPAHAQPGPLIWSQVGGVAETVTLHGIVMLNQTTAWAVGEDGGRGVVYRLHAVDSRWNVTLDAPFDAPVRAVAPINDNNVWAVGDAGLIAHKDTNGWRVVESPVPGASLRTIQMFGSGEEGWAGGALTSADGTIFLVLLHYTNGRWQQDTSITTTGQITSLHFVADNGWAVGTGIRNYSNGRWVPEGGSRVSEAVQLNSVWAIDADEAWAVGSTRCQRGPCPEFAHILHRVGGTWQEVLPSQPLANRPDLFGSVLLGVSFSARSQGIAVGVRTEEGGRPLVLRYREGSWFYEYLPPVLEALPAALLAVNAVDSTHILAVGSKGVILSYGYGPQTPLWPASADGSFAGEALHSVWERTDQPIARGASGLQPRSWLWGPQPLTAGHREPYAEAQGGSRLVQYFDKSRMEITHPDGPHNQWYVTNGLLVVELITGRLQVGDNTFEIRTPAEQAVAGDPNETNPNAPTYGSFRAVAYPANPGRASRRSGEVVTTVLTRNMGQTFDDASLARYDVRLDTYEEQLGHNIPKVFTDFFAQQGLVYENGRYVQGPLLDWRFVLGLPISEPYWARVKVGGVEKDVLMQAFERRVLTYTPDNPPAWRVEMGNVGQHYLGWRYGQQ